MNRVAFLLALILIGLSPLSSANGRSCPPADVSTIAEAIAGGHAYDKHVVGEAQFVEGRIVDDRPFPHPTIGSRDAFARFLVQVMSRPTATKPLASHRRGYWDAATGTVVITNPADPDCGTAFRPARGILYYRNLE